MCFQAKGNSKFKMHQADIIMSNYHQLTREAVEV